MTPVSALNTNPHGRGPICPHFFQRPITHKVLKCKNLAKIPIPWKTSAESKSRVMYPSKNVNLCLLYASEQAKVLKKSYWLCIPSLMATAFSPTSRQGGWVAVGGGGKAAKQGESPFTAKMRPFVCRVSASQSSEHFA